ncbi:MAG: acetate--CoA ligase family protein [Nitrososphaerota archaeon]
MNLEKINEIFKKAIMEKRKTLTIYESKEILYNYDIPISKHYLLRNLKDIDKALKEISFPIALKISSPQIIHKTDIGGIKLNINSKKELIKAYNDMIFNIKRKFPNILIEGILIEEMIKKGIEIIIGGIQDSVFGPCIMFGLGGIFVEVYNDTSFRACPLSFNDALEMIMEIKGFPILKGIRGEKPINIEELCNIIIKLSDLMIKYENLISEFDINPIIASSERIVAVDARFLLK